MRDCPRWFLIKQLQVVDGQPHVFLLQLVHPPGGVECQDDKGNVNTPHPPRVPPGLTYGDGEFLCIDDSSAGAADALQHQLVSAGLHADKTDILIDSGLTPFSVVHAVAIGNVEMVAHVDAFI